MNTKRKIRKPLLPLLQKEVGPLTFGMFLRVSRDKLGMTQAEMARKLKIARGTLCDIEKGRQLVSPELAIKIARKVGLSEVVALKACFQDQINKLNLNLKVKLAA